jgi:hypothetical protein
VAAAANTTDLAEIADALLASGDGHPICVLRNTCIST